MSYTVNGKVYTSHALMDEIIYYCKIIMRNIVLKNEKLADRYETEESLQQSNYYMSIKDGTMTLELFPLNEAMLMKYGYTFAEAYQYCEDPSSIPEKDRDKVLEFCENEFLNNYVDGNNYFRMLNGLPGIDTCVYNQKTVNLYDITLGNGSYEELNSHIKFDNVDYKQQMQNIFATYNTTVGEIYDIPISDKSVFTPGIINTLKSIGIIDILIDRYITRNKQDPENYRYLKYLGTSTIDVYTARKAEKYDIIYMPPCDYMISNRFRELYSINEEIYKQKTDQLAYSYMSDYYDEMMMFLITCQTVNDMVVDTPEWYIRRDVIDLRSVQYFLESQGMQYFEDIPMKYQIRIVKGLNKLIRYKSTTKNIDDILEIFAANDAVVYKYYLLKKYDHTEDPDAIDTNPSEDNNWKMDDIYECIDENYWKGKDISNIIVTTKDVTASDIDPFGDPVIFYDFYDESGAGITDDPNKIQIYEFGDEDSASADDTNTSEANTEYNESKKVIKDEFGNVYDLEFLKVPIGEDYDDYIKDGKYRVDYDTITEQDKYWDGEDVHSLVKNNHLKKDFTIEGSKFMQLEYNVSLEEFNYQREYYLGLIFNNAIKLDDVMISVPSIGTDSYFGLRDIFIFLYCCNGLYSGQPIDINNPLENIEGKTLELPEFSAFKDYNGGESWSGDGNPDPKPVEKEWSLTNMDFGEVTTKETPYNFGNEDTGTFTAKADMIYEDLTIGITLDPSLETNDFGEVEYEFIDNSEDEDHDVNEVAEIYDFGDNTDINPEDVDRYYDFSEITETSDDTIEPDEPEPEVITNPKYSYDNIIKVTEKNYTTIIGQIYVDQNTGNEYPITVDNCKDFIGQIITIRNRWNNEIHGVVDYDANGHGINDQVYDYHDMLDGGDIEFNYNLNQMSFYEYIRSDHPYVFTNMEGRINGFNMGINLNVLANNIGFRHSAFGFDKGYTLEDVGCDKFIVQKEFKSLEEMYNVYTVNTECYNKLKELYKNADTRDKKRVYEYVYYQLFTTPYDPSFYLTETGDMATTYDQILKKYNFTLYNKYVQIMSEPDKKARLYNVRNIMNDIVETLNYYINGDNLKYALSFVYTNSIDSMMHYIMEMINFLKSWKVYFLDPIVVYHIGDNSFDNGKVGYGDQIGEFKIDLWNIENHRLSDANIIKPVYYAIENEDKRKTNYSAEVVDVAAHYMDNDILGDKDYDGGVTDTKSSTEIDGGGVSIESSAPYYQIEAWDISQRKNLYDLDGGDALPVIDYLDIDGTAVTKSQDESLVNKINPQDPALSFDVNAGYTNPRRIQTKTAITKVNDFNQISVDARISNTEGNGLSIRNNGVYFNIELYAPKSKMERKFDYATWDEEYWTDRLQELYDILITYGSLEGAINTINRIYNELFAGTKSVLAITDGSGTYKNHVSSTINYKLNNVLGWWYDIDPYKWGYFEEDMPEIPDQVVTTEENPFIEGDFWSKTGITDIVIKTYTVESDALDE